MSFYVISPIILSVQSKSAPIYTKLVFILNISILNTNLSILNIIYLLSYKDDILSFCAWFSDSFEYLNLYIGISLKLLIK